MAPSSGGELGMKILEALGMPWEDVTGVEIKLDAGSVATLLVRRHIRSDEGQRVSEEFKVYHLVDPRAGEDEG